jgi:hypothetical protein
MPSTPLHRDPVAAPPLTPLRLDPVWQDMRAGSLGPSRAAAKAAGGARHLPPPAKAPSRVPFNDG